MSAPETFTPDEVEKAIESFLSYGEKSYGHCHKGYFSGDGWSARALRYHLEQLKSKSIIPATAPGQPASPPPQ